MAVTHIKNGTVVDPANHSRAFVGDIWIEGDHIVSANQHEKADVTVDATGLVIMPGGVDVHSHFVGPKVNAARKLIARESPDGIFLADRGPTPVPSITETARRYVGLGYTTAFDAAIPPLMARQAQLEIDDLPWIDAGFFALVGNHRFLLEAVSQQDAERVEQFLSLIMLRTQAYAPKVVNPGGVENWKLDKRATIENIDQSLVGYPTTPRQIIESLATAANCLQLPHPIHIHCNRLGMPGNWRTTLATMEALGQHRGHLAHVQFHSYRGADDEASFGSAVGPLVNYVNDHKNISVDVGQVMFGSTMSMTADSPLGEFLQQISGAPWISIDTEQECGCGISPIQYKRRNRIHALQWAIGLEWFLLAEDPWQVALSTDHPNGATFLAYPQIIALLMDSQLRREQIRRTHLDVLQQSVLNEIDREYSLHEIAIITRAAPARILGLPHKGHLGPGADADLVLYAENNDRQQMFEFPRMVIKSGTVVLDGGQLVEETRGRRISPRLDIDPDSLDDVRQWFAKSYSTGWT